MGNGAISKPSTDVLEKQAVIYRQALGRIAKLGDLYDATTDNFFKETVFQQPLPPDSPAISSTDNDHSESKFVSVSNLEEKFRGLNIGGELQLSILAGMCKQIGGSAEYLNQDKNSFGTVINTQISCIKTVTERLEVSHDHAKRNISKTAMHHPGATHVVIEIEWGANCVITAREQKHIIEKKRESRGKIGAFFSWLLGAETKIETEEWTETSVEISGDVLPDVLPQTMDGVKAMMANIPKLIQNCNDGKGKPLIYVMIPIWDLGRLVSKKPPQLLKTFKSVDDARTLNIVRLFDYMTELRQKYWTEKRKKVEARLKDQEAIAKSELYQVLEKVRSGEEELECLDAFYNKHFKAVELICPV